MEQSHLERIEVTSQPEISLATAQDASLVFEFIQKLAEYERMPDQVTNTLESIQTELTSEHPKFYCFLARVDGEVAGFQLVYNTYSTFAGPSTHLEDLFVDPKYRGHGIGKKLMEAAIEHAKLQGHARVDWETLDWNTPIIHLSTQLNARQRDGWLQWRLELTPK